MTQPADPELHERIHVLLAVAPAQVHQHSTRQGRRYIGRHTGVQSLELHASQVTGSLLRYLSIAKVLSQANMWYITVEDVYTSACELVGVVADN